MRTSSIFMLFVLTSALVLAGCQGEISREQAIRSAQMFVDDKVKFYVDDPTTNRTVVNRASITVTDASLFQGDWSVVLNITSNTTGQDKTSGMIVVVDGQSGRVMTDKTVSFRPGQTENAP